MWIATIIAVSLLVLAVGLETYWCRNLTRLYRQPRPSVPDDRLPKVALVLTLRGADPFLQRTLEGLTQLDYPRYDIRIVVDHREDPAWNMVQRIITERGFRNVLVEELRDRRTTCSLRMSSLIQAVSGLDESYEAVAIVDADVVTHPGWLRDLVSPLADPQVGATSGVRWFSPDIPNVGSLVRYLWNAAAVPQMHAFGIGWGGSLAVRTSLLRDAGILETWSQIMFEDTFTADAIQSHGYRLEFVPAATMINHESIDLVGCTRFISRQMMNARMYHRGWPAVATYACLLVAGFNGALAVGAAALATGHVPHAIAIGAGLAAYSLGMAGLLAWIESTARQGAVQRGEPVHAFTPSFTVRLVGAGILTHYVYLASVLLAVRIREIEWRGIKYRLSGPRRVHLLHYSPYRPHLQSQDAPVSL